MFCLSTTSYVLLRGSSIHWVYYFHNKEIAVCSGEFICDGPNILSVLKRSSYWLNRCAVSAVLQEAAGVTSADGRASRLEQGLIWARALRMRH
jgi:hypothetical protein